MSQQSVEPKLIQETPETQKETTGSAFVDKLQEYIAHFDKEIPLTPIPYLSIDTKRLIHQIITDRKRISDLETEISQKEQELQGLDEKYFKIKLKLADRIELINKKATSFPSIENVDLSNILQVGTAFTFYIRDKFPLPIDIAKGNTGNSSDNSPDIEDIETFAMIILKDLEDKIDFDNIESVKALLTKIIESIPEQILDQVLKINKNMLNNDFNQTLNSNNANLIRNFNLEQIRQLYRNALVENLVKFATVNAENSDKSEYSPDKAKELILRLFVATRNIPDGKEMSLTQLLRTRMRNYFTMLQNNILTNFSSDLDKDSYDQILDALLLADTDLPEIIEELATMQKKYSQDLAASKGQLENLRNQVSLHEFQCDDILNKSEKPTDGTIEEHYKGDDFIYLFAYTYFKNGMYDYASDVLEIYNNPSEAINSSLRRALRAIEDNRYIVYSIYPNEGNNTLKNVQTKTYFQKVIINLIYQLQRQKNNVHSSIELNISFLREAIYKLTDEIVSKADPKIRGDHSIQEQTVNQRIRLLKYLGFISVPSPNNYDYSTPLASYVSEDDLWRLIVSNTTEQEALDFILSTDTIPIESRLELASLALAFKNLNKSKDEYRRNVKEAHIFTNTSDESGKRKKIQKFDIDRAHLSVNLLIMMSRNGKIPECVNSEDTIFPHYHNTAYYLFALYESLIDESAKISKEDLRKIVLSVLSGAEKSVIRELVRKVLNRENPQFFGGESDEDRTKIETKNKCIAFYYNMLS